MTNLRRGRQNLGYRFCQFMRMAPKGDAVSPDFWHQPAPNSDPIIPTRRCALNCTCTVVP